MTTATGVRGRMNISPLVVASWPTVEWYPSPSPKQWPRFRLGGIGLGETAPNVGAVGTAVWVTDVDGQAAGLSWDWIEVQPNVIAFRDPNYILSNLRILQDEDHYASPLSATLMLMRLASSLPWQQSVVSSLTVARNRTVSKSTPD